MRNRITFCFLAMLPTITKTGLQNNSNYVPTWESKKSLNPVGSYIADDYFGLLDGDNMVDIGIGRLGVKYGSDKDSSR